MKLFDFIDASPLDAIATCPLCGDGDHEDNRLDESLYIAAAREAPRLRHEGKIDEAVERLTALAAIRIVNWARPSHRCPCGVTFDA